MKARKLSIHGQKDTVLMNKEIVVHLKDHLLVIKSMPRKTSPEKRRKERKHDKKCPVLNGNPPSEFKTKRNPSFKASVILITFIILKIIHKIVPK